MHFHAPSEHTIDGENKGLELHLVHRDVETLKAAAVVSIMFDVIDGDGQEDIFLDGIEPALYEPDDLAVSDEHIGALNLMSFLEDVDFRASYYYDGSFTTPPCTEGIKWFVVTKVR